MSTIDNTVRELPDVARHAQPQLPGTLDWVGMDNVQVPLVATDADGTIWRTSARVDAHISLVQADARGIHMSRLYLLIEETLAGAALTPGRVRKLLHGFLDSHPALADRARLRIRYEQLKRRPALRSGRHGWRAYPITIEARLDARGFDVELATDVLYSSTCPASAALARQLIQAQFEHDFAPTGQLDRDAVRAWLGSERGMIATPHAQRSVATVRVRPAPGCGFDAAGLIDHVEHVLGTPVQAAVKREDEQAFALANGGNLMFCEDAARRIQRALDADEAIADFAVRVRHEESLHPHDAIACATKGVPGGYDCDTFNQQVP